MVVHKKNEDPCIHWIINNLEEVCEEINSNAYQVNWAINHINVGSCFLALVGAQFEHGMEMMKVEDEEDENEDDDFK